MPRDFKRWREKYPRFIMGSLVVTIMLLLNVLLHILVSSANAKVSVWIDEDQIEQYMGMRWTLWIVQFNRVLPMFQDERFMKDLPVLPYQVTLVNLTWEAGPGEVYFYKFERIKSRRPDVMYDPLLSVPNSGKVPPNASLFQLAIPCTGRATGVVEFDIVLQILDKNGQQLEGSPYEVTFTKNCSKLVDQIRLLPKEGLELTKLCRICRKNPPLCKEPNLCVCKEIRRLCQKWPMCKLPCQNGGTCAGRKCQCQPGFSGRYCEYAGTGGCGACKNGKCTRGGRRCHCYLGWRGKRCDKRVRYSKFFPSVQFHENDATNANDIRGRRKRDRKNKRNRRRNGRGNSRKSGESRVLPIRSDISASSPRIRRSQSTFSLS